MIRVRSRDRVRIADGNVSILEALGDSARATPVFNSQAIAVAFAAAIGFHFNKFEPFAGQSSKAILFQQIDSATDLGGYLDAIFAIAHAKNISILMNSSCDEEFEEDCVFIFEGYVNGGLSFLRKQNFDPNRPMNGILALVDTLDPINSGVLRRSQ